MVVRKNVNIRVLDRDTILKDKLREVILDDFMVKYYWTKMFSDTDTDIDTDSSLDTLFNNAVHMFLKVRGFGVAKYAMRQKLKELAQEKQDKKVLKSNKAGNSMRQTLNNL